MAEELPKTIRMRPIERSAHLFSVVLDEDGNPVATIGCDCSAVTELVLAGAVGARVGTQEVAFTCDGCMSSHWLKLQINPPPADQLGLTEGDDRGPVL